MSKISVVINTLNEARNLPGALASVRGLADEIVVVDMKSTDATRTIARKAGARVFEHKPTGYVEPARNYAIEKASGEWILVLDADERLTAPLRKKLKLIIEKNRADYYRLPRRNFIFGKWIKHSRWWPDYNIRFFKKGSVEWGEIIHSVPTTTGEGLDLEASEENAIVHHHYDSIEQYLERMNRYTTNQSTNLIKEGYVFRWQDLIIRPTGEFLSRYFQGQGYKDGLHGLVLASLQSVSELVLYLKTWQEEGFKEEGLGVGQVIGEMKKTQSDVNYWQADTLLKELGGIKHRVKRKLKLP